MELKRLVHEKNEHVENLKEILDKKSQLINEENNNKN